MKSKIFSVLLLISLIATSLGTVLPVAEVQGKEMGSLASSEIIVSGTVSETTRSVSGTIYEATSATPNTPLVDAIVMSIPQLNLQSNLPPNSPQWQVLQELETSFEELTASELDMTLYLPGVLVPPADVLTATSEGSIDMFLTLDAMHSGQYPALYFGCVSGLINNSQDYFPVLDAGVYDVCKSMFEVDNITLLGLWPAGQIVIAMKDGQVLSPSDLVGKKIQTNNSTAAEFINQLGGIAVNLSMPDVYVTIQKGLIDGVMTSPMAIMDFNLFEVAPFITTSDVLGFNTNVLGINSQVFDGLTPEAQQALTEICQQLSRNEGPESGGDAENAVLANLKSQVGVSLISLSFAQDKIWLDAAGDTFINSYINRDGICAQQIVDIIRGYNSSHGIISGHVYDKDTGNPIPGAVISVVESEANNQLVASTATDDNGCYVVSGLPGGSYWVIANAEGHVYQYWDHTLLLSAITTINLTAPDEITGIDFTLKSGGGSISGHVYESGTTTPIQDVTIFAYQFLGGQNFVIYSGAGVDENGYYQIGLPAGNFLVMAKPYTDHWSNQAYSNKYIFESADVVEVTDGNNTGNIDFNLEHGGSISGQVMQPDGVTPLNGATLIAFDAEGHFCGNAATNEQGHYTIYQLYPGEYSIMVRTTGYFPQWYSNEGIVYSQASSSPVAVAAFQDIENIDLIMEQSGISGKVIDTATGKVPADSANGSIDLNTGWHKVIYRHVENEGGQAARAAFKKPGSSDWLILSTFNLEVKTSLAAEGVAGILLTNKENTWVDRFPRNHEEMVQCVDNDSSSTAGWYGQSIVEAINQGQNIHGNDDHFTSYYEAYFYADTAGSWSFSTDSDDASEIIVDDQIVASWYQGHGSVGRWEHKGRVTINNYSDNTWIAEVGYDDDGNYLAALPPGTYRIQARVPGYIDQFYQDVTSYDGAVPVTVNQGIVGTGFDFSLYIASTPAANVHFNTNYNYFVSEGNFTNTEVSGNKNWSSGLDGASLPLNSVNLNLASSASFDYENPTPDNAGSGNYQWNFGTLQVGTGAWVNAGFKNNPVSFTPGFDASRSFDQTLFTSDGIQTLTVSVTPRQILQNLGFGINVGQDQYVNPTILPEITSPDGAPLNNLGYSPAGIKINIDNPVVDNTYTYEITISLDLKPGITQLEYMPGVNIGTYQPGDSGLVFDDSISCSLDAPGTWSWGVNDSILWNWNDGLYKGINFRSGSTSPSAQVNFNTENIYTLSGDSFANSEVTGYQHWSSRLNWSNIDLENVKLMLASDQEFVWGKPTPDISGPPVYQWSMGSLPQGISSGAFVGLETNPVNYAPGFNASRSLDRTAFTSSGTQILTISVTPVSELGSLNIGANVMEDDYVFPVINGTVTSPNGSPLNDISLSPDGHNFNIFIANPEVGTVYIYQLTLQVTLKNGITSLEYKPQVIIKNNETLDSGSLSGNSLSHSMVEPGTWTWSADESILWNWNEGISKGVNFTSYSAIPSVVALFNTNYGFTVSGDNFTNTQVSGNKFWSSGLVGNDMVLHNVELNLEAEQEFDWVHNTPAIQTSSENNNYQWSFGKIPVKSGIWVSAGFNSDPIDYTPGFDASRSADRTSFTEDGDQILTISIFPEEPISHLEIGVSAREDLNVNPVIDGEITSPDGAPLNNVTLSGDGHILKIHIFNLEKDRTYTYRITLHLALAGAVVNLEYMPFVDISNDQIVNNGTFQGNSVERTIEPSGTWNWSSDDTSIWNWIEGLWKGVNFSSYSTAEYYAISSVPSTPPDGEVKAAYPGLTLNLPADNTTYKWSWKADSGSDLPKGLTLKAGKDTHTAVIKGKPTKAGTFSFTVTATGKNKTTYTRPFTIQVYPALTFKAIKPAVGEVDVEYALDLSVEGGKGPYNWMITKGNLPTGLVAATDESSIKISGIPEEAKSFSFTYLVTDSLIGSVSKTLTIKILPKLEITTPITLPSCDMEIAYKSVTLKAKGGTRNYTWTKGANFPAWLELTGKGVIKAVALPESPGVHEFTVILGDTIREVSKVFSITVNQALAITISPVIPENVIVGATCSYGLSATGGNGGYKWTVTGLPAGLKLTSTKVDDNTTYAISGTFKKAGKYTVKIKLTDSLKGTVSQSYTIVVNKQE